MELETLLNIIENNFIVEDLNKSLFDLVMNMDKEILNHPIKEISILNKSQKITNVQMLRFKLKNKLDLPKKLLPEVKY